MEASVRIKLLEIAVMSQTDRKAENIVAVARVFEAYCFESEKVEPKRKGKPPSDKSKDPVDVH